MFEIDFVAVVVVVFVVHVSNCIFLFGVKASRAFFMCAKKTHGVAECRTRNCFTFMLHLKLCDERNAIASKSITFYLN